MGWEDLWSVGFGTTRIDDVEEWMDEIGGFCVCFREDCSGGGEWPFFNEFCYIFIIFQ